MFSCKPLQNVTVTKEVIRIDTVRDYKVITKYDAVHDTLTIENPCDSSGILTSFYSRIRIPQGKVVVRSVRGKIQAIVDIDSIESVYRDKYRNGQVSNVTSFKNIVTKNVIPKWAIWFMAISGVLSFLYIREKVSIFVK
jgi:NADH:ubiquinone oxidoreductase subunit D